MLRKIITMAALALGLSAAALAPANARGFGGFHGGGFHGGFGGFHGGGFHGGFGGFHHFGGGFRPGFGGGRFAFRGHDGFRRGFFGLGALGGLAYAGGYPYYDDYYDNGYYGYGGYGGGCYLQREWLWNGYRYVNQLVRVCQ